MNYPSDKVILIIDDEPLSIKVLTRMIEGMGWRVISAQEGKDAFELYSKHHENISCVLLDLTMPGWDGIFTAKKLQEINPEVKIILMTGYDVQIEEECPDLFFESLGKPFTIKKLRSILSEIEPKILGKK